MAAGGARSLLCWQLASRLGLAAAEAGRAAAAKDGRDRQPMQPHRWELWSEVVSCCETFANVESRRQLQQRLAGPHRRRWLCLSTRATPQVTGRPGTLAQSIAGATGSAGMWLNRTQAYSA
jgi:hypothetical protein